jgi:peroxiredoxin
MRFLRPILLVGVLLPGTLIAQGTPLPVGTVAPVFALPAATAAGVVPRAFSLEEMKGRTVVMAFFYKARTSG